MTNNQAQKIIEQTKSNGLFEIMDGYYLNTQENILFEQMDWDDSDNSKEYDFTKAPYWLTCDSANPVAVNDVLDLIKIINYLN